MRRDFSAYGPDRMWVADITQVRAGSGWLYLCGGAGRLDPPGRGLGDGIPDASRAGRRRAGDGGRAPPSGANPVIHHLDSAGLPVHVLGVRTALPRGGVLQSMGSVGDAYDDAWTVGPSPPVSVRSAARRPSHHYLSARLRGAPARAWMRSLTVNVTRDVRPALRALAAAACRALSHATARKPDRAAGPSHRSRDLLQRWRQSLHRTLGRAMFPLFSAQSEWDCPCSILGEEVLQGRVQYSV